MKNSIVFVITNDPGYDQRMQRICSSLQANGYNVTLIGTDVRGGSSPQAIYRVIRLHSIFRKGKLFYAEFHIKAFLKLLFLRFDAVCAVDLDTALPCYLVSKLRNKKRVYDAHELFCELPEIINRPSIYKTWKAVERWTLPHFKKGYTVSDSISAEYNTNYNVHFTTIRNVSVWKDREKENEIPPVAGDYILYQGALNEGRGIEQLLEAMQEIDIPLVICGEGNFSEQARNLVSKLKLEEKIQFHGMIHPSQLHKYTRSARLGINLGDGSGRNNYLSLNNKFFDYIHAELPQVAMDFPEFRKINDQFEVAVLIPNLDVNRIKAAIKHLLWEKELFSRLKMNCSRARVVLNWQEEEKKLLEFYHQLFETN